MRWVSLSFVIALAACGGSSNGGNGTEVRGAYPAGPYGTAEGAVIEPLAFVLSDGTPRSLEDVWSDETRKLLFVTTASGWCVACREEQPVLRAFHETYGPRGLAIIVAVFEDSSYQPATKDHAESWKRQYDLPFDVVADTDFKLARYYNRDLTPMSMIVDVSTMKMLRISTGFDASAIEAIIMARLP